jgi:type IV secretory pathway TrbD component
MPDRHPVRITTARTSHSDELRGREKRYLLSMAVRTVCVVLAVVADGFLRWGFIAGAVILPYVAVVMANVGARTDPEELEPFEHGRGELPPGPQAGR